MKTRHKIFCLKDYTSGDPNTGRWNTRMVCYSVPTLIAVEAEDTINKLNFISCFFAGCINSHTRILVPGWNLNKTSRSKINQSIDLKSELVWILNGPKQVGLQMVRITNSIWNPDFRSYCIFISFAPKNKLQDLNGLTIEFHRRH